jgi:uncharacterized protein
MINLTFFTDVYSEFESLSGYELECLGKAEVLSNELMYENDVHGIGHVKRVLSICSKLIKAEGGNPFITFFASWLHDIGRIEAKKSGRNHALVSEQLTRHFIEKECKELDSITVSNILNCIRSHSFSLNSKQTLLEAKILSDADKIDALGSIGIYRASCFQNESGTGLDGLIEHFKEKLLTLNKKIHTRSAKIIAEKRIKIMQIYLQNLKSEVDL